MPINLLINYWREIVIAVLLGIIAYLMLDNKDLQLDNVQTLSELQQYKFALGYQNDKLESNRADYVRNMADANKTKEIVRTEYKTRTEVIYKWSEQNETNSTCEDAMRFLNDYQF